METMGITIKKFKFVFGAVVFFFFCGLKSPVVALPAGGEKVGFNLLSGYDYGDTVDGRFPRTRKGFIPDDVRALDERVVELVGYVMPIDIDDQGIRSFALIKDQSSCCFGQTPRINHWVFVTIKGKALREIGFEPTRVVGTLKVGEFYDQGFLVCIYRLDADKVEKAVPR